MFFKILDGIFNCIIEIRVVKLYNGINKGESYDNQKGN